MTRIILALLLFGFGTVGLHAETFRYVAPHVTTQPPWLNKLVVYNNGEAEAGFTVIIRTADGQIGFQETYAVSGNASRVLVWPTEAAYVPNAGEVVLTPVEGSLMVETASEKLRPKAAFRYGDRQSLTEFFLQPERAWEFILPNTVEAHFSWTGLALFNPYEFPLMVSLQAYMDGQLQDTRELEIDPQRKYVNLSFGVWPGIDYTGFDQVKIRSDLRPFPPPMSITGNDAQDRHVFFNGAPTSLDAPVHPNAGTLVATDSIVGHLRYVPAGTFVQGAPSDEPCQEASNSPQFVHTLTRGLAVMETELTRQMWADLKSVEPSLPDDPSHPGAGYGMTNPVQQVNWYEAVLYANLLSEQQGFTRCYFTDDTLTVPIDASNYVNNNSVYCDFSADGYRLPTEAEWEYFCRAGTMGPFWVDEPNYTSDNCWNYEETPGTWPNLERVAWFMANRHDPAGDDTSKPVGLKEANPWGMRDIHGNVSEWCWDWQNNSYPSGHVTDYKGPNSGEYRIGRGGDSFSETWKCRVAFRNGEWPGLRSPYIGFRLVRLAN
ncbi:MAG: formylglycine-generating enzyme family protein [Acidobacteria bacterium]|nr:formylglycine-generating enzyme family protein [Acidobacteriota bacterium]